MLLEFEKKIYSLYEEGYVTDGMYQKLFFAQ